MCVCVCVCVFVHQYTIVSICQVYINGFVCALCHVSNQQKTFKQNILSSTIHVQVFHGMKGWRRLKVTMIELISLRDFLSLGLWFTCVQWHDMTWHDMTWHDMTWHDKSCRRRVAAKQKISKISGHCKKKTEQESTDADKRGGREWKEEMKK